MHIPPPHSRRVRSLIARALFGGALGALAALPFIDLRAQETFYPYVRGGQPADLGTLPFMVAVLASDGSVRCGGSLIAPGWVLTARHCIADTFFSASQSNAGREQNCRGSDTLRVKAGFIRVTETGVSAAVEAAWPEPRSRRHPQRPDMHLYDIALLKLCTPFPVGTAIAPVRFVRSVDEEKRYEAAPLQVAGWGTTENPRGNDKLNYADVKRVDNATCNKTYGGAVTAEMTCAGGGDTNHCRGDSGGPLIVRAGRNPAQAILGVASQSGCNEAAPGVHARIAPSASWIVGCMERGQCR